MGFRITQHGCSHKLIGFEVLGVDSSNLCNMQVGFRITHHGCSHKVMGFEVLGVDLLTFVKCCSFLDLQKPERELDGKACAAVGQSGLMALYDSLFSQVGAFLYCPFEVAVMQGKLQPQSFHETRVRDIWIFAVFVNWRRGINAYLTDKKCKHAMAY